MSSSWAAHPSHKLKRYSATEFDLVCVRCGAHEYGPILLLAYPCGPISTDVAARILRRAADHLLYRYYESTDEQLAFTTGIADGLLNAAAKRLDGRDGLFSITLARYAFLRAAVGDDGVIPIDYERLFIWTQRRKR